MKYKNIVEGRFISRPNRFIAKVNIDGKETTVHVKNTGRCKELLIPGCKVYLEKSDNPARKTGFDLIAVEKARDGADPLLINMDSQIVNDAAEEWITSGIPFGKSDLVKREVTYANSRFDFYIEKDDRKIFLEVKGVTLETDGIAAFPDAPTQRGIKHINELISAVQKGYEGHILFVIQMKGIRLFRPNYQTHPEFGEALKNAAQNNLNIRVVDCIVTPDSVTIDKDIPFSLDCPKKF